jgi:hypothetical protein
VKGTELSSLINVKALIPRGINLPVADLLHGKAISIGNFEKCDLPLKWMQFPAVANNISS